MKITNPFFFRSTLLWVWFLGAGSWNCFAVEMTLVDDGRPNAVIITAENPSRAINLAARELQYHIEKITGAVLPIKPDNRPVTGNRLLVGENAETRKLGLTGKSFASQEYLIQFQPGTIVLMGRDQQETPEILQEAGYTTYDYHLKDSRHEINYRQATGGTSQADVRPEFLTLPSIFDEQGTCYAAYDFLERFCDVRWYGPTELTIVFPRRKTLTVRGADVRRRPDMPYRTDGVGSSFFGLWADPSEDQVQLYHRRLRVGGEKWAGNHSFYGWYDRFMKRNPERPEIFEGHRSEFFAEGQSGDDRQLCYTAKEVVQQTVQEARDYFDGKGLTYEQKALGDHFCVVPMDHRRWCQCDNCRAILNSYEKGDWEGFSTGASSHYFFNFVNEVAKEVYKTHPDKFISTLAYAGYCYYPDKIELSPNISIAPCLHPRNYWNRGLKKNDIDFYKDWVNRKDRPVYLWNYYCFPAHIATGAKFHCFPGFSAHTLAEQIKMYHADGVRGVFLCGIGEQVDYYLSMKLYDDASLDTDALLDELFCRYFGAAALPMKNFYLLIERIYSDPENYRDAQAVEGMHQTEAIAWGRLGTEKRMTTLGRYMDRAQRFAVTDLEKKRVNLWKEGVWDYMVQGRQKYLAKSGP
jgi:hypothetical protein